MVNGGDESYSEESMSSEPPSDEYELGIDSPDVWDLYEPELQGAAAEEEVVADVEAGSADHGEGRVIVLAGPRSGMLVPRGSAISSMHVDTAARRVPTAPEALAPGAVTMLVHRPGRYAAVIPGALARIHSDFARSGLTLGVSAGLPKKGVSDTANYLDQCGTAAIKIADPEGFALPTDLVADPTLTEAQRTKVSYVQSAPQAGTPADRSWNKQVAREQRAAGANVLLTPGRSLDPNNATWELAEANRALDDLIDEVDGDEVPAWNLTLPATWLIDENLRGQLLAELVDRDDALVWYIRVRWPLIRRSFGQTLNSQLLTGYRELAETARLEDRALLLPATGLTGWLALSWGALGFGTGPSSASQAWADHPRIAARPGVTRTTVNRFFSSPLLHTISVDSHNSLARTLSANDYPPCDCSYCETQAEALTWQPQTAAGHAVYAMGRLASAVASRRRSERASEIARLVRRSNDLYNSLPLGSQLDPKEEPEHLSVWQAEVTGSPR